MTILPKKKADHTIHKSDSDSDSECCCAKCCGSNTHPPSRSEERPNSHHRRRPEEYSYEAGASCASSEIQPRGKRQHGASPKPKLTGEGSSQWRWDPESSTTRHSGYNSSEEYESSSHGYDLEVISSHSYMCYLMCYNNVQELISVELIGITYKLCLYFF